MGGPSKSRKRKKLGRISLDQTQYHMDLALISSEVQPMTFKVLDVMMKRYQGVELEDALRIMLSIIAQRYYTVQENNHGTSTK